ncbi:altronate oxidoreductase [Synergistales bacterium]|nr:altronate oxidoreductase [Synergistales bacterium]
MKILQFGEGNFLRCFFDWMLQKIEDSTEKRYEVTLVQPIPNGLVKEIAAAGEYHVLLRGYEGDKYIETLDKVGVIKKGINPYEEFDEYLSVGLGDIGLVVSNTTEAGIFHDPAQTKPHNFPSFLALLLNKRVEAKLPPLSIMAMELNDRSADLLKKCLTLYGESFHYGAPYAEYLESCVFYNTLVDRIVPGFPTDAKDRIAAQTGKEDPYLTSGELFHLLVIEGDKKILDILPFDKAGLNVIVTPDKLDFYHDRKVRILNGAHTSSVPVALLSGIENVDKFASHPEHSKWLASLMHGEICRALDDSEETHAYADEVLTRFKNPALGHSFRSIALNSVAKVNARLRPTLEDYFKKEGKLPPFMTGAISKMRELYSRGAIVQLPGGSLELKDYSDIKSPSGNPTAEDYADSFFPGLNAPLRAALIEALRTTSLPS